MQHVSPLGQRRSGTSEVAVRVDNVSKTFHLHRGRPTSLKERIVHRQVAPTEDFLAIDGISLGVQSGTTYGIVGHNGSGKSTLLRLMARIYQPTTGRIKVDGRIAALLELGAGFHPDLTGRENIYLNASILGLTRSEVNERVDQIIDFSGIGSFIDSPVKVYSSGMYVRLGFAVAVNVDPDVLLIDEVIAVGDAEFQRQCFDHLHDMRIRGVTIILVTHAHTLVQELCDHAAWLDHGRLMAEGDSDEVIDTYIDHVNKKSISAPAATTAPAEPNSRPGTGEIRITDVAITGPEQTPTRSILCGEPLGIHVSYHTSQPVDDPVLALTIVRADGAEVTMLRSDLARVDLGSIDGDGTIRYSIPSTPLLEATYVISVGFYSRDLQTVYDVVNDVEHIAVFNTTDTRAAGLVDLGGGVWQHEPH